MRSVYWLGLAYLIMIALHYHGTRSAAGAAPVGDHVAHFGHLDGHDAAALWFARARPHCNPLEADLHVNRDPAPEGPLGAAFAAACTALTDDIGSTREAILDMPEDERWRAVGVIFEMIHPIADAGEEVRVGPLMELVVEFWPNHYMALYHAGSARYRQGDHEGARSLLHRFLNEHTSEDAWRLRALEMIMETDEG